MTFHWAAGKVSPKKWRHLQKVVDLEIQNFLLVKKHPRNIRGAWVSRKTPAITKTKYLPFPSPKILLTDLKENKFREPNFTVLVCKVTHQRTRPRWFSRDWAQINHFRKTIRKESKSTGGNALWRRKIMLRDLHPLRTDLKKVTSAEKWEEKEDYVWINRGHLKKLCSHNDLISESWRWQTAFVKTLSVQWDVKLNNWGTGDAVGTLVVVGSSQALAGQFAKVATTLRQVVLAAAILSGLQFST